MNINIQEWIFSEKRGKRIYRHLAFWLCWFLYLSCTQLRNQTPDEIGMGNFIVYQMGVSANRVLLQIIFVYPFVYYILPRFTQTKNYILFAFFMLVLIVSMYVITYIDYLYIWSDPRSPVFFDIPHVKPLTLFQVKYFSVYSNVHCTGTFVSATIMLAIKYYENWYRKQRENENLIYQNAQAELQLLKAQVHPHFLFNTLNNIYSLMLDDSPKAVTVIHELSGMVLYMNNECANPTVPVDKEIKMLFDYIGLEKIRYGERLNMMVDIKNDQENELMIAPLLMIPFVENSFKHAASKTMDKTEIHLSISLENDWLKFMIRNKSYPNEDMNDERIKIGLNNVKKRLQLLYPGKHNLDIQSTEIEFTVTMKILLEKQKKIQKEHYSPVVQILYAYAQ